MRKHPATTLDPRFSEATAVPASWEETRKALDGAQLFWLVTVRASGRPHVTPLVAVWLDDALHFSTGSHEQKALNLEHNPKVAVITGCSDWDDGSDIVVEGVAVRVESDSRLERLAQAWRRKWDGRWQFTVASGGFAHAHGGEALVYRVEPEKVLVFGKGTFSQTRHRFDL